MPDLNLGPPPQSSPLKSIFIAIAILVLVAVAVFYFNPRKTADLSISNIRIYAAHTTTIAEPGGIHVIGQAAETENDLYVAATLHIENKLRLPIFINSIDAVYTASDGSTLNAKALSSHDISRIEETFPAVTPLMSNPLSFDPAIAPGSAAEGAILLHFPGLTRPDWKTRKSVKLTVNLAHQSPQTVTVP